MNKQPEQTAKTRQSIMDAFWELALKAGIDKVSVSAVTKRAGLNRGTFYVYFTDMPDLLAQIEEDMIRNLQNRMHAAVESGCFADFDHASDELVQIFVDYDDKFFLLIGPNGDPQFRKMIQSEASEKFRELFKIPDAEAGNHIMAYLTSAMLGTLTYWHETGKKISVIDLASIIHVLATNGILGLV